MAMPSCPITHTIIRYPSSHGHHFFETGSLMKAIQNGEPCPVCQHSLQEIQLYDVRYFEELRKYHVAHPNTRIPYDFHLNGRKFTFLTKEVIDTLQKNCEIKAKIHHISQKIVENLFPIISLSTILFANFVGKSGSPLFASEAGKYSAIAASIAGILLAPFSLKTEPLEPEDEMKVRIKRASIIGVGLGTAIGLCGIKVAHLFGAKWSILAALVGGPVAVGLGQTLATSKLALLKPLSGLYIGTSTMASTYLGLLLIRSISVVKDNVLLSLVKGILASGLSYCGASMITSSIAKGRFTHAFTGSLCMILSTLAGQKTAITMHSTYGILSAVETISPFWHHVMKKSQEKTTQIVERCLIDPIYHFFSGKTDS